MQPIPPELLVCRYLVGKSFIEARTPHCFATIKVVFKERREEPRLIYEVYNQKTGKLQRRDSALLYDFFRYLNTRKLQLVNVIGGKD